MFVVLAVLLWVRRRTWWTRAVPICLGVSAAAVIVMCWCSTTSGSRSALPVGVDRVDGAHLALVVARMRLARWPGRVLMVFAVLLSLVATRADQRQLRHVHSTGSWSRRVHQSRTSVRCPARTPRRCGHRREAAGRVWQPPSDMPANGNLYTVDIPSSTGFLASKHGCTCPRPTWHAAGRAARDGHARR